MSTKYIVSGIILLASTAFAQQAPVSPTPPPPEEHTIMDIPESQYKKTQAALEEAFVSKQVAELTAKIEQLIDERDALTFTLAGQNHPELRAHLDKMSNKVKELKAKRGKQ